MRKNNFILIQGWMINDLDLKGNELLLFAIIYGFSQDGHSTFYGSWTYIEELLKISRKTVSNTLKTLLEKKYIVIESTSHYRVSDEILASVKITPPEFEVVKDLHQSGVKSTPVGGVKLTPNIYNTNNKDNNTSNEDIAEGKNYTKQITLIMDLFKVIDTGYARHFKNTTERNACKELYSAYGIDAVQKRIEFVPQYNKLPYIGSYAKIYKPSDLLRNWVRMEDEIITYKNTKQEKSNKFKMI